MLKDIKSDSGAKDILENIFGAFRAAMTTNIKEDIEKVCIEFGEQIDDVFRRHSSFFDKRLHALEKMKTESTIVFGGWSRAHEEKIRQRFIKDALIYVGLDAKDILFSSCRGRSG